MPVTTVEHNCQGFEKAIAHVRQAIAAHDLNWTQESGPSARRRDRGPWRGVQRLRAHFRHELLGPIAIDRSPARSGAAVIHRLPWNRVNKSGFFRWLIWTEWTSKVHDNSARVLVGLAASGATFALKLAASRFLCVLAMTHLRMQKRPSIGQTSRVVPFQGSA